MTHPPQVAETHCDKPPAVMEQDKRLAGVQSNKLEG